MNERTEDEPMGVSDVHATQDQRDEQELPQNSDGPEASPNQQGLGHLAFLDNATSPSQLPSWLGNVFPPAASGNGGLGNGGNNSNNVSQNQPGEVARQEPQPEADGSLEGSIEGLSPLQSENESRQQGENRNIQTGQPIPQPQQSPLPEDPVQEPDGSLLQPNKLFQQTHPFQLKDVPPNQLFFGEWSELATGIFSKGVAHRVAGQPELERPLFPLQYLAPAVPVPQWNYQNNTQPRDDQDIEMGNTNMDYGYQNDQGHNSSNFPQQGQAWGVPHNEQACGDINFPSPQQGYGALQGNDRSEFDSIANQGYIQGSAYVQESPDINNPGRSAHHATVRSQQIPCPICNHQVARRGITKHVEAAHFTPDGKALCFICNKGFSSAKHMIGHYRAHHNTGGVPVRQYACPVQSCGLKFQRPQDVDSHMARVHTGNKPHQCLHCTKTYMKKWSLGWHVQRAHPDA